MKSESMETHKKKAPKSVKAAVLTLSDSKYRDLQNYEDTDLSGRLIVDSIKKKNQLVGYEVIPDDAELLVSSVEGMIQDDHAEVIITTGGTGIGPRDITIETLKPLFEKELPGFGEIFRYESYKELGTGAIMSRATAGIYKNTVIVSMPGSPNAVKTGLKIIVPELGHLVKHLRE
ncbi:MogA/MoaB family molybdenum cofactor biosynthesis protein [Methanobacterium aggregans]|uniref:MogA/MoaB family molybdenum cofactor biosynthesis protein n=1 Tax=Methanobacterium aggregans TaxID=1615586 RepID=UPI001AE3F7AC|nr:MogA/MoaB family molybdenum cofactor biosynthesis protein [Methanobacterium aggregans]MBP2044793.1 molybdenum cofactor biosynthesis protein B [Methanobacterium aggregans]